MDSLARFSRSRNTTIHKSTSLITSQNRTKGHSDTNIAIQQKHLHMVSLKQCGKGS